MFSDRENAHVFSKIDQCLRRSFTGDLGKYHSHSIRNAKVPWCHVFKAWRRLEMSLLHRRRDCIMCAGLWKQSLRNNEKEGIFIVMAWLEYLRVWVFASRKGLPEVEKLVHSFRCGCNR